MWRIDMMEYYTATLKKKNKSKPFAAKWVQLEDKFNEVSQA